MVLSAFTLMTSGEEACFSACPTCGSSTTPGLVIGAVIMKMISSTSITSMYGTTLIWFIRRRERLPRAITPSFAGCW